MNPIITLLILGWFFSILTKKLENGTKGKKSDAASSAAAREQAVKAAQIAEGKMHASVPQGGVPALGGQMLTPTSRILQEEPPEEGDSVWDEEGCIGGSLEHDPHMAHEGSAAQDEEGCIGGSIEHAHDDMRPRVRAAAMEGENPEAVSKAARNSFDATSMRRAFIASEVLRRPLAMRGKGNYR